MPVHRYSYSERLAEYLEAGFFENKALKVIWNKEPLNSLYDQLDTQEGTGSRITGIALARDKEHRRNPRSVEIINEATECFILYMTCPPETGPDGVRVSDRIKRQG